MCTIYKGESVNRLQMDIKCKTYDIQTWNKPLFLDISSTNIDTLVPTLYHWVVASGTCAPPFQPLRHERNVCYPGGFLADQTDGSH
jgi:hypothetical protein